MRIRVGLVATIATVAAAGALVIPSGAAADQTIFCSPDCDIVVNSTVDEPDADPGDGACATLAGDCTLRAAVQEANAKTIANVLVPRGDYVLTRHGLDDDASHGDLDIRFRGQLYGAGQSRTVVDGDGADRVFDVHFGAEGFLSHLAVRHGRATDGPGGGIRVHTYPYTLEYLYVSDNEALAGDAAGAGNGGGIAALNEVAVRYSQVAYNDAVNGAGMWWTGTQGSFSNSTFAGNHASGDGGGLYLSGGDDFFVGLTVSSNTAGGHGGGVYLGEHNSYGGLNLSGSTIASNSAPQGMGGGLWVTGDPADELRPSVGGLIVSNNGSGRNCAGTGALQSRGGNVDEDDDCGFDAPTDLVDTDPLLENLAYNGGPIQTRALDAGSPAIDQWSACTGFGSTVDARGVAREPGACDSGAFELAQCCPAYEPPYVPPKTEEPPPPPPEGDCGVLRSGTNGADVLVGDRRRNEIYGRGGDDQIFGRFQADCLYGGRGSDFVRGGEGTDLLVGYWGADHLSGGDGEDVVRGGRGADRVLGGADEDRLLGGPGDDYLKGGGGFDTIDAGPGNDEIDATGAGLDVVECGSGFDRVRAERRTRLSGCERVRFVD
jgi:CSLREA domain-containing protein